MKAKVVSILALTLLVSVRTEAAPEAAADLPKVLVIGDSISIGYMEPLQEILKGEALVVHNPGNAAHSRNGLANLEQWLGEEKWDVVHFNHGLHDLKYVDSEGKNTRSRETGHVQIPLDEYERNMEGLVARLERTGAKLIFATTTPFPEGVEGPLREPEEVAKYNEAALGVMKKHGVAVDDLHGFCLPRLAELQRPNNVHFTPEGSRALAQEAAKHIRAALGEKE